MYQSLHDDATTVTKRSRTICYKTGIPVGENVSAFGDRVRARRSQLGLTQDQVAKLVSVSRVAITKWENGGTQPEGENLFSLSKALNCEIEWLLYGSAEHKLTDPEPLHATTARRVPLISWVRAGAWTDTCNAATLADCSDWISTTANVSKSAFALTVRGDSMQRSEGHSIPEGAKIIVDPQFDPDYLSGKVVVAMLDGGNEATVKELMIDGPSRYLVPWNTRYNPIPINGNCRIVGIVKQVVIDLCL